MIYLTTAIKLLAPEAEFTSNANGVVNWLSPAITQPTTEEIATEVTRLQAAYDSQAYSRQRQAAYAALNQFEMQFDDAANSTTTWVDAINAIKEEFPK